MKVKATHRYAHGLDTVYAAFCDPAFYAAKFAGVGARNVKVLEHEKKGASFRIRTEREMRVDVPAVLKTVLGEWNRIVQSEHWKTADDSCHNELELISPAVPVSVRGIMDLSKDGKSCVNAVEMDIRCELPFIGKKLAELVAGNTERGLADEYEFIRDYLAAGGKQRKKRK
jgi:Protein of unknown function (DUF2505)